jgi:hypothetical protein
VLYCQATSSFAGWVRMFTLMGLVRVRFLVDMSEQAMWYEVVWLLLVSSLRQEVVPTSGPHLESCRHECCDIPRYYRLFEIINSGSGHCPFDVVFCSVMGGLGVWAGVDCFLCDVCVVIWTWRGV